MSKRTKLSLLGIGTFLLIAFFLAQYYFGISYNKAEHIFNNKYRITFRYNPEHWNIKKLNLKNTGEYISYIVLQDKKEPRSKYISFRYELINNGDDSPLNISETGAPPWPPQPEELMEDFNPDKFIYLGKYLGKELYVSKYPSFSMGVVQKLSNGKITPNMPLLSKNKERVNYYDNFSIIANARGENVKGTDYKELHKEFLQILKTLKIEEIK